MARASLPFFLFFWSLGDTEEAGVPALPHDGSLCVFTVRCPQRRPSRARRCGHGSPAGLRGERVSLGVCLPCRGPRLGLTCSLLPQGSARRQQFWVQPIHRLRGVQTPPSAPGGGCCLGFVGPLSCAWRRPCAPPSLPGAAACPAAPQETGSARPQAVWPAVSSPPESWVPGSPRIVLKRQWRPRRGPCGRLVGFLAAVWPDRGSLCSAGAVSGQLSGWNERAARLVFWKLMRKR